MRYSQLLIPTVKEVPAEAEIASHQLMIRAGYIRKLASGTYTYLPLGWRSLKKIMAIVRQEMDAAGAQEVSMPILQPVELWQKTGRDVVFQDILCSFTDHRGRSNVLAPTAEEVVTSVAAAEISSYKQLPINLYQINTKFRDEFRPRFGVLRSREFIMKDAYSFDATAEALDESYRKMYDAYCRIFSRSGLKYVTVEAESGGMGGTDTEEFMVLCSAGEDTIVHNEDFSYAANIDRGEVDPPSTDDSLSARKESLEEPSELHTPDVGSIEAVCSLLHTTPAEMIKTLIYSADGEMIAALVRGDHEINESKLSRTAETEAIELADEAHIESATGARVGFAGPIGLAEKVSKMVVDHSVAAMAVGIAGANKTDYHVKNVVPGRDFPLEGANVLVGDIRNAVTGDTHNGQPVVFSKGIEVGHVFKLGTKYSKQLDCSFLDEDGDEKPCIMGCYGIGVNRILASAIELGNDESGCILPINIAPFEVEVLPLNNDDEAVVAEAERIYKALVAADIDVLIDDRSARPGVKFKDADLIGIPIRITVGQRGLKEGKVEIKLRTEAKPTLVAKDEAVALTVKTVAKLKQV